MRIQISIKDGVPIYLQIVQQIKYLIACGRLQPGDELPAVRVLAEQLVINPNTVTRAYRDLETAGLVHTQRGKGVFVADSGSPLALKERRRILDESIDKMLAEASQLQFSVKDVIGFVEERAGQLATDKQEGV
jgi:GntR family transcriptional regulator